MFWFFFFFLNKWKSFKYNKSLKVGLLTLYTDGSVPLPVTNFVLVTRNFVKEVNLPQFCMINSICVCHFWLENFLHPDLVWYGGKATGLSDKSANKLSRNISCNSPHYTNFMVCINTNISPSVVVSRTNIVGIVDTFVRKHQREKKKSVF